MGSTRAFIALCATSSVVGSISTACAMHYLGEDDKIAAGGSTVINGMLTVRPSSHYLGSRFPEFFFLGS